MKLKEQPELNLNLTLTRRIFVPLALAVPLAETELLPQAHSILNFKSVDLNMPAEFTTALATSTGNASGASSLRRFKSFRICRFSGKALALLIPLADSAAAELHYDLTRLLVQSRV